MNQIKTVSLVGMQVFFVLLHQNFYCRITALTPWPGKLSSPGQGASAFSVKVHTLLLSRIIFKSRAALPLRFTPTQLAHKRWVC